MGNKTIAIIGRPNVGKSALFNRLVGARLAIVEDTPGVTRDRLYGEFDWRGKMLKIIDTGGIEPYSNDEILKQMRFQAEVAITSADLVVLVTDVTTGVTASDQEVTKLLQKSGKPVVVAVNKCDRPGEPPAEFYEFYNLGLGEPIPISAAHGQGTGDLLDRVFELLGDDLDDEEEEDTRIKVAVIGKPNVGKSSLINRISGQERSIVTNIPGTTRDSLDTVIDNDFGNYVFIDTAGIRRQAKVKENIEKYSVLRSYLAVDRADVCLIMIDALEGFTEQDSKIAGYAHEAGKACVIVVNKWDALEKDDKFAAEYRQKIAVDFAFMSYAPFLFISVKTGQRVNKIYEMINEVYRQNHIRISTGKLNEVLAFATARVQPPTDKGRRLKLFYITQATTAPPTFVCFANSKKLFHFSYQRYIENQIRETFKLNATPVRLIVRERGKEEK